jgi:NAD(P)-dependent dehydrogenase (short-subunit alcohol dehydrogenase family)
MNGRAHRPLAAEGVEHVHGHAPHRRMGKDGDQAAGGEVVRDRQAQQVRDAGVGRFGQPQDIARVAGFLASDGSAWLTGERITASGGWR